MLDDLIVRRIEAKDNRGGTLRSMEIWTGRRWTSLGAGRANLASLPPAGPDALRRANVPREPFPEGYQPLGRPVGSERARTAARAFRLASERGLSSCMNATKWREVCEAFGHWSSPPPRFRIRDLLAQNGHVSEWDREWHYHPLPYASIQWLEVELPAGEIPRALAACERMGAPAEATDSGVRIPGWQSA